MQPSHVPLTRPQASAAWAVLQAGDGPSPYAAIHAKRHPHDAWSPVTADPALYTSSVRFAGVLHLPSAIQHATLD